VRRISTALSFISLLSFSMKRIVKSRGRIPKLKVRAVVVLTGGGDKGSVWATVCCKVCCCSHTKTL